ncbi:MAG: hypothetical protein P4L87_16420 [Formivibrio sp.]|nr:hypothetical protein [Formivibrio sp.]
MPKVPVSLAQCANLFGHSSSCHVFALTGLVLLSAQLQAAGLGDIRTLSALGERFEASLNVSLSEGEAVSSDCFQITPPHDASDVHVLHNARIEYRGTGQGGEIRIHGTEYEQEPLMKLAVRLRCPEEATRGITREYSVLLDPRDYKATKILSPAMALSSNRPEPVAPPKPVPPSPSLSSNTFSSSTGIQQAAPRKKRTKAPHAVVKPATNEQAEFRLQLSTAALDPERTNLSLSEDQKQQLREHLLLLEADDQTAQLLQLKDRIGRLEKQLASMRMPVSSTPAVIAPSKLQPVRNAGPQENFGAWLWAALGALLLIPLGFVAWRWRARKQAEQELFSFDAAFENTSPATPVQETPATAPIVQANSSSSARNEDWGEENMDVVSPESVAEEAQLLLDHGLTRQAIELLLQETALRPTALALWMKLFEAYCLATDRQGFETQAQAFRTCFVSDALWEQVQDLGKSIDPGNPLYVKIAKSSAELVVLVDKQEAPRKDASDNDFDVIDLLQQHAPPEMTQENLASEPENIEIDLPLDFHLPEDASEELNEWTVQDPTVQAENIEEPLFDFDIPASPSQPEISEAKPLEPEDFSSEDTVMQNIARMIFSGPREEACRQLEELLFRGTLEQRLLATKWLDKLLPVKDSF